MQGRRGQVELCCKIPLSAQQAELSWPLLFLSSSPLCMLVQEVPKSKLAGLSCPTWKQALRALSCNICLAVSALYIGCPCNIILKALIKKIQFNSCELALMRSCNDDWLLNATLGTKSENLRHKWKPVFPSISSWTKHSLHWHFDLGAVFSCNLNCWSPNVP